MLDLQLRRNEAFSIATLIYARLRRVTGRVIDAMYLAENIHYAKHVIGLAEQTEDPELLHLVNRLKPLWIYRHFQNCRLKNRRKRN